MEMIALDDAKKRLSEICNQVLETGEPCLISRHGKAVVKLVPVCETGKADSVWDTMKESRARYGSLEEEFELLKRKPGQRPNPLEDT
ncbi:MAG: type II toxin-antitoxin system Phd/YefM family antitoxin [Verrucomicrobiota bacterium]